MLVYRAFGSGATEQLSWLSYMHNLSAVYSLGGGFRTPLPGVTEG